MNYSELLSSYIRESKMSLSEISEKLKEKNFSTDKGYLSKLQNGKIPPAGEKLNTALAEILNGDSDKLEFFAYVEKAPDLVKSILSNFNEELIEAFVVLSKDFPDKTINILGENDPDVEKTEEFQKIYQFTQQMVSNNLASGESSSINNEISQIMDREFSHLPFYQENEEMIKNYLNKYGLESTVSLIKDLSILHTVRKRNKDFNATIQDLDLYHWYQTLPLAGEKKLRKLRTIWEMMQDED